MESVLSGIYTNEVNMKQKNVTRARMDAKQKISIIQDKIDEELNKPECEIDMNIVDNYFKQIRELDGGVYEKSDEQIAKELENIYKKANKNKKKPLLWYLNTTRKQAAAILIAIGIFFGLSIGVYATREPIVEFFLNVKEKFSEVFFNQEDIEKAPETIEMVYTLGYVPEGYTLSKKDFAEYKVQFIWQNQNGEYINFTQYILKNTSTIDIEDSDSTIIYVNEMKVIYSEKLETKTYFWNIDGYAFSLRITDSLSTDESIKLIESLMKHND